MPSNQLFVWKLFQQCSSQRLTIIVVFSQNASVGKGRCLHWISNIILVSSPGEVEVDLQNSVLRVPVKIPRRGITRRLVCITWFLKSTSGTVKLPLPMTFYSAPWPQNQIWKIDKRRNVKTNRCLSFISLQTINILWRKFNTTKRLR